MEMMIGVDPRLYCLLMCGAMTLGSALFATFFFATFCFALTRPWGSKLDMSWCGYPVSMSRLRLFIGFCIWVAIGYGFGYATYFFWIDK